MYKNPDQTFDVVIAGGSFAGLAMARALSTCLEQSVRIAIVDRGELPPASKPPADGRASAISSGAKRMLDALGLWADLAENAQPVSDIELTDTSLHDAVRQSVLHYDNKLADDEPASFIVENRFLVSALLAAAAGDPAITLIGGTGLEDYSADETCASLTLNDGRILKAALAIAADGGRSRLRQAAGIKCLNWDHGQAGIVTIVSHGKPHNGRAFQHFLPGGPFAILPLTGNRACITWSETAIAATRIMALDDSAFLAEVETRFGHRLGELALAGPRGSWPLTTHLARSYIARRLALIGDAAHGVHPIAGQGLNLALRDAAALTEVLVESARLGIDIGGGDALERYERWRRFDSTISAAAFGGLNALFSNDSTLLRTARSAGLGVVERLPGLKRFFVEEAAGLTGDVPRLLKGELV